MELKCQQKLQKMDGFLTLKMEHKFKENIFLEKISINENELKFSLSEKNMQTNKIELDESIIIVGIITIISIGAAIFYLKGYKK